MATGTESTSHETVVSHRWDGREDDLLIYNDIFDAALMMVRTDDDVLQQTSKVLFQIINEWEKNKRAVGITVISASWDLATAYIEKQNLNATFVEILKEITDGSPIDS